MPIDPYSMTAFPITIQSPGIVDTTATGFFYRKNSRIFLVTNWHVLSGRNNETGQPNSDSAAIPVSIGIPFHVANQTGQYSAPVIYSLYSANQAPIWKQHAIHGQAVDIAVLEISVPPHMITYPINEAESQEDMRVDIGMDVFIVGFPIRLFTGIFPIWKRASLATEHDILIDGLRKFLVDTATREGMSGAPVILRQRSGYMTIAGILMMGLPAATKFLGVYSGRYGGNDLKQAQLGVVWHKDLIDEIIGSGTAGQYIIR